MNMSNRDDVIKALGEFSPNALAKNLIRSQDGVVYVDRAKMIDNPEKESRFYYMINRDYIAGYKNIKRLTVYFEVVGNEIVGGGYDPVDGKKTSRRRIISTNENVEMRTPYTYTKEDLEKFKNTIKNA